MLDRKRHSEDVDIFGEPAGGKPSNWHFFKFLNVGQSGTSEQNVSSELSFYGSRLTDGRFKDGATELKSIVTLSLHKKLNDFTFMLLFLLKHFRLQKYNILLKY